ncbi:MAG: hypothetical protein WD005_05115, partial [Haliea sp.]
YRRRDTYVAEFGSVTGQVSAALNRQAQRSAQITSPVEFGEICFHYVLKKVQRFALERSRNQACSMIVGSTESGGCSNAGFP